LATGEPLYQKVAQETAEWVLREMQSEQGGYFSTLDADSEGVEGKFYVWDAAELKLLVEAEEYQLLEKMYALDEPPNFEGKWHFHTRKPLEQAAAELNMGPAQATELFESARQKLFRERELRVRPGRDEKILVSWNALMIKGMAAAGRVFGREEFVDSAQQALDFIRRTLWKDGRLLATYKDGRAHLMAYLDDYVYLMDALLELSQARWREGDVQWAAELADVVLQHFEDEAGGFYFTADDHENLIQRPKVLMDEATPAGNGVGALALLRLGHLLGETRYLDAAQNTLATAWENITRTPYAHNALLLALEEYLYSTQTVVIRGTEKALAQWRAVCEQSYAPRRVVLAIPNDAKQLPGLLAQREPQGEAVAYVCEGHTCQAPVTDLEAFKQMMK
jgi:uncharacterized protein YyaL (SSP411 family)